MDWAALFACITALGTGWFAYNQLKHNRLADIKAKELERQWQAITDAACSRGTATHIGIEDAI